MLPADILIGHYTRCFMCQVVIAAQELKLLNDPNLFGFSNYFTVRLAGKNLGQLSTAFVN